MSDEEKIMQAACDYITSGKAAIADNKQMFKDAVEWRDENPSPKVLALEAEIDAMDQLVIEWQAEYADLYDRGEKLAKALETIADEQGDRDAQQALAEWEKK